MNNSYSLVPFLVNCAGQWGTEYRAMNANALLQVLLRLHCPSITLSVGLAVLEVFLDTCPVLWVFLGPHGWVMGWGQNLGSKGSA